MRPESFNLNRFTKTLTHLGSMVKTIDPQNGNLKPGAPHGLGGEFTRLIAPVTGESAAADLYYRFLELYCGRDSGTLEKLGNMAAFFLGEYDDSMDLQKEDWEEIRKTLEDASEEIDLETLTTLMGDLVSRGMLN
jgi:hypothetical protein